MFNTAAGATFGYQLMWVIPIGVVGIIVYSEMCGRVVDRVVQIYGGAGYLAEYDAERFFRDARVNRLYEGTTQIQKLQIAKHMLREWKAEQG